MLYHHKNTYSLSELAEVHRCFHILILKELEQPCKGLFPWSFTALTDDEVTTTVDYAERYITTACYKQVGSLFLFFQFSYCKDSLICLEDDSTTPYQGDVSLSFPPSTPYSWS